MVKTIYEDNLWFGNVPDTTIELYEEMEVNIYSSFKTQW